MLQGRGYTSSAAITTVINAIITALSQNLAHQVAGSSSQANVSPDFYIQSIKMLDFNLAPVHTLGQNLDDLSCVCPDLAWRDIHCGKHVPLWYTNGGSSCSQHVGKRGHNRRAQTGVCMKPTLLAA